MQTDYDTFCDMLYFDRPDRPTCKLCDEPMISESNDDWSCENPDCYEECFCKDLTKEQEGRMNGINIEKVTADTNLLLAQKQLEKQSNVLNENVKEFSDLIAKIKKDFEEISEILRGKDG